MKADLSNPGPFETLGLLASADRQTIERRAEALSAILKLGLSPPEGDAVHPGGRATRDAEAVAEAARALRDPHTWLLESLLWPDCRTSRAAMTMAAQLLEGAAGRPAEPAGLVRHLALEYLSEGLSRARPEGESLERPDAMVDGLLAPPTSPPLYLGGPEARDRGGEG